MYAGYFGFLNTDSYTEGNSNPDNL